MNMGSGRLSRHDLIRMDRLGRCVRTHTLMSGKSEPHPDLYFMARPGWKHNKQHLHSVRLAPLTKEEYAELMNVVPKIRGRGPTAKIAKVNLMRKLKKVAKTNQAERAESGHVDSLWQLHEMLPDGTLGKVVRKDVGMTYEEAKARNNNVRGVGFVWVKQAY